MGIGGIIGTLTGGIKHFGDVSVWFIVQEFTCWE